MEILANHYPDFVRFHRYNIEIPLDLYDQIQEHINKSGQNLKGFFTASAKFYIKNKAAED